MDERRIRAAIEDIACALLRWVDPDGQYLVIRPEMAAPFIADRLLAGLPTNMVGHRDSATGHPIRDLGIYCVSPQGSGHQEIAEGWVEYLVTRGIADVKWGSELTVQDIRACATMTAIAFLEADQQDVE